MDAAGGLWLLLRHHPLPGGRGEVWNSYALRYHGRQWSPIRRLASSADLIDNRPALTPLGEGILAVYSGDGRIRTANRDQDDLFAAILNPSGPTKPPELIVDPAGSRRQGAGRSQRGSSRHRTHPRLSHRRSAANCCACSAASSTATPSSAPTTIRTACSKTPGAMLSTPPTSTGWATATTTTASAHEYMWWLIQKSTDLFQHPPRFVGHARLRAQRRLSQRPSQRDHAASGHPPAAARRACRARPEKGTPDTKLLYAYLKHFGGICSSHTSATNMGTDWRDNDPEVEPVVEIYQGHRHNYEHFGAPRSADRRTRRSAAISRRASSGTPWRRATASASRAPATTSARTSATPWC